MMKNVWTFISSLSYIGYLRGGGTVAAAVTAAGFYFTTAIEWQVWIISAILLLGVIAIENKKPDWEEDDSRIVIDESAGVLFALFLIPHTPILFAAGFLLFRIFDIWKPFPVRLFEKIGGSAGVMLDDVAAGILANVILRIILKLI